MSGGSSAGAAVDGTWRWTTAIDLLPDVRKESSLNGCFELFSTPGSDPQRPIRFLQTGQSANSRFCELECSEAAIGDLNEPAINGRWRNLPKAAVEAAWVYAVELACEVPLYRSSYY